MRSDVLEDYETKLTYQAESVIYNGLPAVTIEQARTIADTLGMNVPIHRDFLRRSTSHWYAAQNGHPSFIHLSHRANAITVVHELAHEKRGVGFHDDMFRRCYVTLMRELYGDYWANALEKSFRDLGLRVAGPHKDVVV